MASPDIYADHCAVDQGPVAFLRFLQCLFRLFTLGDINKIPQRCRLALIVNLCTDRFNPFDGSIFCDYTKIKRFYEGLTFHSLFCPLLDLFPVIGMYEFEKRFFQQFLSRIAKDIKESFVYVEKMSISTDVGAGE